MIGVDSLDCLIVKNTDFARESCELRELSLVLHGSLVHGVMTLNYSLSRKVRTKSDLLLAPDFRKSEMTFCRSLGLGRRTSHLSQHSTEFSMIVWWFNPTLEDLFPRMGQDLFVGQTGVCRTKTHLASR